MQSFIKLLVATAVNIVEAHDIVLAEVITRLYFDNIEDLVAGIFEIMRGSQWYENRLVFMQVENFIVAENARGAFDYDPVFGAMVMHLL